jgi:hypothetical protein
MMTGDREKGDLFWDQADQGVAGKVMDEELIGYHIVFQGDITIEDTVIGERAKL